MTKTIKKFYKLIHNLTFVKSVNMKINNCLKEWNVIIEALGQGKQTILIRSYKTKIPQFLLYPTSNYARKDLTKIFSESSFQFVNSNLLPFQKDDKILIKYFIKIEDIIEIDLKSLDEIEDYYLWNTKHVEEYLRGINPFIWLVRVYKLKEPKMVEKTLGMRYARINEFIETSKSNSVLGYDEFQKITKKLSF